jgi:hypothetical protein
MIGYNARSLEASFRGFAVNALAVAMGRKALDLQTRWGSVFALLKEIIDFGVRACGFAIFDETSARGARSQSAGFVVGGLLASCTSCASCASLASGFALAAAG